MTRRLPFRSRAAALLAAASVLIMCGRADAEGWRISSSVSQSFSANSNAGLADLNERPSFTSATSGGMTFASSTSRSNLSISPGVRATGFLGSGAQGRKDLIVPSFAATYGHRVGSLSFSSSLGLDIRPTRFSELVELDPDDPDFGDPLFDLDVINRNANEISIRGSASAGYQVDSRNRFSGGVNVRLRRFTADADTLTATNSIGANLGFSHRLFDTTSASLNASINHVDFDNAENRTSLVYSVAAGLNTSIAPGFSLGAQLGVDRSTTTETNAPDESNLGLNFSVTSNYAPTDDISLSLRASQSLVPGTEGDLQTRTRLSLGASHLINDREGLNFSVAVSRQDSEAGGAVEHLVSTSAGYSLAITRDMSASLSYAFRWRPDGDAEATSHNVAFTISKSFLLQQ